MHNSSSYLIGTALAVLAIGLASGCGGSGSPQTQPPAEAVPQPALLGASHILIMHRDSDRAPASIIRTRQEALTLVQEVAAKAKAEGADFAALAGEYSDCPSSAKGGDLGRFAPDQMVAAFSEATERLAVGEISDPVETQFGFHIIRRDP